MRHTITQEQLKKELKYDPETGVFIWRSFKPGRSQGKVAGHKAKKGSLVDYVQIRVIGQLHLAHRLVWLYVYGYFPENMIDHINRIRHDNRICNLREVNHQCNIRNTGNWKHNTSGVKGIYKKANKWQACIQINKKSKFLGNYKSFDNAVCARLAGEQCLGWGGCDSNSPAYKYVQEMLKPKKKKLQKIKILKN